MVLKQCDNERRKEPLRQVDRTRSRRIKQNKINAGLGFCTTETTRNISGESGSGVLRNLRQNIEFPDCKCTEFRLCGQLQTAKHIQRNERLASNTRQNSTSTPTIVSSSKRNAQTTCFTVERICILKIDRTLRLSTQIHMFKAPFEYLRLQANNSF